MKIIFTKWGARFLVADAAIEWVWTKKSVGESFRGNECEWFCDWDVNGWKGRGVGCGHFVDFISIFLTFVDIPECTLIF